MAAAFVQISEAMKMATEAVEAYNKLMNTQPETEQSMLKRKRAEKKAKRDPNAPKRPMSGFLAFQNEVRAKYNEDHPELAYKDRVRLIGAAWQEMSEEHKAVSFFPSLDPVISSRLVWSPV